MTKTELEERFARADHERACYARALEKMRIMLVNVHDGLEDEGDRIYLGSTNHADLLRDAWNEADALQWDKVLAHTQPETTLAAANLRLQEELTALRTEQPASPASEAGEPVWQLLRKLCTPATAWHHEAGWKARARALEAAILSRPSSKSDASVELRTLDEWHEDYGNVVWWKFPVDEPAWIGTPNDSHWPGYHTHWTPHPAVPTLAKLEQGGAGDAE